MIAVLELLLATVRTTTPAHHAVAHRAMVHSCIWVSVYFGFNVILSGGGSNSYFLFILRYSLNFQS